MRRIFTDQYASEKLSLNEKASLRDNYPIREDPSHPCSSVFYLIKHIVLRCSSVVQTNPAIHRNIAALV
jgi:hypothetical protein